MKELSREMIGRARREKIENETSGMFVITEFLKRRDHFLKEREREERERVISDTSYHLLI